MLCADIPFQHLYQHVTNIFMKLLHRIGELVPRNALRDIVHAPIKFVTAVRKLLLRGALYIPIGLRPRSLGQYVILSRILTFLI